VEWKIVDENVMFQRESTGKMVEICCGGMTEAIPVGTEPVANEWRKSQKVTCTYMHASDEWVLKWLTIEAVMEGRTDTLLHVGLIEVKSRYIPPAVTVYCLIDGWRVPGGRRWGQTDLAILDLCVGCAVKVPRDVTVCVR
jgi:hypothetical protein